MPNVRVRAIVFGALSRRKNRDFDFRPSGLLKNNLIKLSVKIKRRAIVSSVRDVEGCPGRLGVSSATRTFSKRWYRSKVTQRLKALPSKANNSITLNVSVAFFKRNLTRFFRNIVPSRLYFQKLRTRTCQRLVWVNDFKFILNYRQLSLVCFAIIITPVTFFRNNSSPGIYWTPPRKSFNFTRRHVLKRVALSLILVIRLYIVNIGRKYKYITFTQNEST